ncbi:hypothetical protein KCV01_g23870, partial [Aureobasidium melanogenum]
MADENTQKPGLGRRKSSLNTLRELSQRFKHVGRKTSESVEEEREIIGDGQFSDPPQLKMPDFAPFDSTSPVDVSSHPPAP